MKSIEKRFEELQKQRPLCSTLVNFYGAVKGMRFSRDRLGRWFKKLVDKEDYDLNDIRETLDHAFKLSWLEAYAKRPKFRVRKPRKGKGKV